MTPCRCAVLNVMSGEVARDYAASHLEHVRDNGVGRRVHRCPETAIEWTEERSASGYSDDAIVLRRGTR
jgi:hypothetical protein